MKTYTANYTNLKNGNSSTIKISAKNIKEARQLAQRHKTDCRAITTVFFYRN